MNGLPNGTPEVALPEVVRTLVRCDGAHPPAALGQQAWTSTVRIDSEGPNANLALSLESLVGSVLTGLSPRSADLLRIAAFAYRADQLVSRGGEADAHADRWRRHFALCVPVADPEYWDTAAVRELLASVLRFGTDDGWEFSFGQASSRTQPIQLRFERFGDQDPPTCVVMFSGGADSLCALLEAALRGERPVPAGHWSAPAHRRRQEDLLTSVRGRFPSWNFPQVGFVAHGSGGKEATERTQRTRGFLYGCLGAVVAAEAGVGRVLFGDNGPVSLNLPLNGQEVGAAASRSTHPRFLARLNALVADVYGGAVTVENPLADRTRAEVLEVLRRTRCEDLLRDTLSCSSWRGLPEATPHCGGCSQCVDRRFATVAAGLEAHDPPGRYRSDVFLDELTLWRDQMTAESYVRTARKVAELGDLALLAEYGQIYDAVLDDDPDQDKTVQDILGLVKRHARMVLDGLRKQTEEHLDDLVGGHLPDRCLLRTAMAGVTADRLVGAERVTVGLVGATPGSSGGGATRGGGAATVAVEDRGERFACDGDRCEVTYQGTHRAFGQAVGLLGLAVLLRDPFRVLAADEIKSVIQGRNPPPNEPSQPAFDDLWPEAFAGGGRVFDEDSRRFIEKAMAPKLAALAKAETAGDWRRAAELNPEIDQTQRQVAKGLGIGYRPRPFTDDQRRADHALHRAITRAISDMRGRFPELAAHLHASYSHSNRRFSYKPAIETRWRVDLPHQTTLRRPLY